MSNLPYSKLIAPIDIEGELSADSLSVRGGGTVGGNLIVDGEVTVTGGINASISGTTENAIKATQDSEGNIIVDTYATKEEVETVDNKIPGIASRLEAVESPVSTGSTTARTLQDRFADIINVKDFGAKGDGITDDTSAIQAAIAAAKKVSYPIGNSQTNFAGPAIYFPYGVYNVSSKISVEWIHRACFIMDHAVLRATAEMEAVLHFKNCWMHGGNAIYGGVIDMAHLAGRGLWLDRENEGFYVDGIKIKNIGNGCGLYLGDPSHTMRSGARHYICNVLITDYQTGNNDGGSVSYTGEGINVRVSDCYFMNIVVYCCRKGIYCSGGGNNFVNVHVWHDMSPDDTNWESCIGIDTINGANNCFNGVYCDNYARGIYAGGVNIGQYFYYLPQSPSTLKQACAILTNNESRVSVDNIYTEKRDNCNIRLCNIQNLSLGEYMYRDHAKNKKIGFNLASFEGFHPIDPAFNLTNFSYSRSPATDLRTTLSGIYLIGYVRRSAGHGNLHIAVPTKIDADIRIGIGNGDSLSVTLNSGDVEVAKLTRVILGNEPIQDGAFYYTPVYIQFASSISQTTLEVSHTSTGGQDFYLHRRKAYADLKVESVTEKKSASFATA